MRRVFSVLCVSAFVGCVLLGPTTAAAGKNFTAHLVGDNEVPSVESSGQGQAIFNVRGDVVHYKLIVANIENVTQSHIHMAPAGVNGPIVAFLFGFVDGGVTMNGVLAEGTLTAADLLGPLGGGSIDDLVNALQNGNTYVNVHTVAHPSGEIRGQIE